MSTFTDDDEEKLINIVAGYPVLYDMTHVDYRDCVNKENVWKAIGKELNKNSNKCKRKWKAVRDSYQRFKKKHTFGSPSVPKHSKDKRHQLLSFLDSTNHDPLEDDTLEVPPPEEHKTTIVLEVSEGHIKTEEIDVDSQMSCEPEISENSDETTEEAVNTAESLNMEANKRVLKQRRGRIQSFKAVKKKEDDIELFVRHIGEVLRNLPPVEKAQAKKHLYAVLSNYEIMAARKLSGRRGR